ncbi:MAG: hypothetical protein AAF492_04465 [Verrucomicrobiota bacterium]
MAGGADASALRRRNNVDLLSEASLLNFAMGMGFVAQDEVIAWADEALKISDSPPHWLIELSLIRTGRFEDFSKAIPVKLPEDEKAELDVTIASYLDHRIKPLQLLTISWTILMRRDRDCGPAWANDFIDRLID